MKAIRFGAFLRRTLSWWRSARISASSEVRDRKSPIIANQISSSRSAMRRSIARFAALRQWDKDYDMDNGPEASWRGRMAVRKTRDFETPILAQASYRHRRRQ